MHQLMPGPPFKNVINTGTKDNNQFTSELLRSVVSGKLIIYYNSVIDINWLKQQHMLNMLGLDLILQKQQNLVTWHAKDR